MTAEQVVAAVPADVVILLAGIGMASILAFSAMLVVVFRARSTEDETEIENRRRI